MGHMASALATQHPFISPHPLFWNPSTLKWQHHMCHTDLMTSLHVTWEPDTAVNAA